MRMIKLQDLAQIEISNVDKKTVEGETSVKLCNFVDVYYNWAITTEMISELMDATAKENQIEKFTLHKGQVAITKDSETRDDIGVATYIADDMPGVILGYHCILITPNENLINGKYLNVIFHSPYAQKYFEANASGSGQRYTLTNEIVGDFPIPVIDLEKQKQIGNLFSNIDRKVFNNNSICSYLESMAKLLYDYWFVQFDFPDENGKPYKSSGGKMVWNEELKREIPEGWEITKLGTLFDITMGSSPKGETLNENGDGTEFYQGSTDFGCIYPEERVYTTGPIRMAKAQDVLMSVRAPVGAMNLSLNDCCIGRGLSAIHHKSSMFAWNTISQFQAYFDIYNGNGTTFGALTSDDLKGQLVISPPAPLIDTYSEIMYPLEEALKNNELKIRELKSLRDFLLPMLMNGQVKLIKNAIWRML